MALITPIALTQNAFDANNTQRFYFTSTGGDQVVKNKLTIKKLSDDSVVYSNVVETYSFYQDVPSGTLENGVNYSFYFNTYNINGDISENSNVIMFWCFTTPIIVFTNIPASGILTTVSYNFKCTYDQQENEKIESLVFRLYNNQGALIDSSDNLYTTEEPPNNFEYTFNDLLENVRYYVEAIGITVNGTEVSSTRIPFTVQYSAPIFYEKLKLKNNAKDGNINVYTNLIAIDGYTNLNPVPYIDGMVDLSKYGSYVRWDSGFSIPSSFVLQILMKPCLMGNILILKNQQETLQLELQFKREIPTGESTVKDCFYVKEHGSNSIDSCMRSNYVDIMNNNSYVCVWVKKIDTVWDLRLEVLDREASIINWNTVSNAEYNKTTDISWYGESYQETTEHLANYNFNNLYPYTYAKISNGVFDNIYISSDISIEYTTEPLSEWNNYTILTTDFNNSINAGNISVYVSDIDKIIIKRRAVGDTSWLTIIENIVTTLDDINLNVYDYFAPNNTNMEYAIVPVVNGMESSYIISSILSCFNGCYITDGNETYKLYESTAYSGNKHSLRSGVHETLNGEYPIIAYNSKLSYKTFTIEGLLLGYTFEDNRQIIRKSVVKQTEDIINFLKNKKQKIFKDWNGSIYLGSVVDDITPTVDLVNGFNKISFNFVEQGKYNNQTDYDKSELVVK